MAIGTPDKIIIGKIQFGSTTISTTWSSVDSYNGVFFSFTCNVDIIRQDATYPTNDPNYNLYNAHDIQIGWKYALPTGKIFTVKSITVNNDSNADIELEDTDLKIYILYRYWKEPLPVE